MKSKGKTVRSRNLTRSHEDRINYIHQEIYSGRLPSAESLARDTGFSVDVIHSDVRYLREFKNFKIKVSRKNGRTGYYYASPVPEKLGRTFNEVGVMNVALAHQAVVNLPVKGKHQLGLDIDTFSQWLVPHTKLILDEVAQTVFFRPFAPQEIDRSTFEMLSGGVRRRSAIQFVYEKNMALRPEVKLVEGYCFVCAANSWYMIGRDVEKDQLRTYMLSRISQPLVTTNKFKKPKFDLDEYLKGCFIVMKGSESHNITLEFSPWAATYIESRRFVHDQVFEKLPNGGLRMSFWLSCLEEVECWVRWWGKNCKVIECDGLKDRLRDYRDFLGHLG